MGFKDLIVWRRGNLILGFFDFQMLDFTGNTEFI